ncbi:MAG: oligosaccharide flippase family protein [Victivallaceae bacterium]|nr:oligosaccharide flippase family protein [Victivallaceae bacterium]
MKIPIWKNTVTNYLNTFVRLVEGILISRWFLGYLGESAYGLWTLFWSFFVYALLLDFGCGASAQKYTAGGVYEKEPERFNKIISTIFTFHLAMSVLILSVTFAVSFFLPELLRINDPAQLKYASKCFWLFGIGATCMFATGMFSEMLVGLQKIYLRNYINIAVKVIELGAVFVVFALGGGLIGIIALGMGLGLLANSIMAVFVFRCIHTLRLKLAFDRGSWREITSFSLFVYLGGLGRMVLNKSSRLLISIFYGLADVGIFQLSSKVAELCLQAVNQYQENISPLTGALHKRGKNAMLRKIIFNSMVMNSIGAFLIMLPAFMLVDPILLFLFKKSTPFICHLSRLFILSMFFSAAMRSIPQRFMIMSDRHRLATGITMAEAVLNLVLNVILLHYFGMEVVVWNSLGIKVFISFAMILPCMLKFLKISLWVFLRKMFVLPLMLGIPVVIYLAALEFFLPEHKFTQLIAGAIGTALIYAALFFRFAPSPTIRKITSKFRKHALK